MGERVRLHYGIEVKGRYAEPPMFVGGTAER